MRTIKILAIIGLVVAVAIVAQAQPKIQGPFLVCRAGTPDPQLTIDFQVLPDPGKVDAADLITAEAFRYTAAVGGTPEAATRFLAASDQPLPFTHSSMHAATADRWYTVKVEVHYTIAGAKLAVTKESMPRVLCRARLVPTLTEWGMIALGVLLAGSLAWMIRRCFSARPAGA